VIGIDRKDPHLALLQSWPVRRDAPAAGTRRRRDRRGSGALQRNARVDCREDETGLSFDRLTGSNTRAFRVACSGAGRDTGDLYWQERARPGCGHVTEGIVWSKYKMDFDPVRSRLEPRPFVFQARRCGEGNARHAALCRRNQTKCATPRTSLRYCQEEDRFPEFGTGRNSSMRTFAGSHSWQGESSRPRKRPPRAARPMLKSSRMPSA
jgi:hypothetical protein